MKKKPYTLLLVITIVGAMSYKNEKPKANPLLGSWDMVSIEWISKDTTYIIQNAQPGTLLINENRYALIWTPTKEKRTPFKILSQPTDEEISNGFKSIIFNTGYYKKTDTAFISTAQIAKVPGFEGGKQFYSYKIKEPFLEMIMYDETYSSGKKPDWYGIWKTKFILKKVQDKKD